MSEKRKKRNMASDQFYSFYWNYNDQLAHSRMEKRKKRRRKVVGFCVTLLGIFLICFATFIASVQWALQNLDVFPQPQQPQINTQPQTPPPTQPQTRPSTADIAEMVKPSVVLIEGATNTATSLGTGFFLTADGYIATNHHIIESAIQIRVTLYDGTVLDAKLIGYRAEDDLAIIKVAGKNYPPVKIGDSNILKAGDIAIAIGNPSGADGGWSTTQGIISATNRIISVEEAAYFSELKMIQTDAPVNPGNSGGPLCNDAGEVIGIVTRKKTDYEGMGYAIPMNEAMLTLQAIMDGKIDGFVSSVSKSRPKIGVTGVEITKGEKFTLGEDEYTAPVAGFFVIEISPNTGAYGIVEIGDIICGVNGVTVSDFESFKTELYKCYVGQKVTFELYRRNQKMTVEITLGVT